MEITQLPGNSSVFEVPSCVLLLHGLECNGHNLVNSTVFNGVAVIANLKKQRSLYPGFPG